MKKSTKPTTFIAKYDGRVLGTRSSAKVVYTHALITQQSEEKGRTSINETPEYELSRWEWLERAA